MVQILALLSEIPATSRKYQFAMAMADRIMEENARYGHMELLQINRMTLASAFARTSNLLCETLKRTVTEYDHHDNNNGTWSTSLIRMLPMGSYLSSYMKGLGVCVNAIRSIVAKVGTCHELQKKRQLGGIGCDTDQGEVEEVMAEKLAQELLWITTKVKDYGTVDDALVQWSFASDLASLSLTTINVRVQGFIVKISGSLSLSLSPLTSLTPLLHFYAITIWIELILLKLKTL